MPVWLTGGLGDDTIGIIPTVIVEEPVGAEVVVEEEVLGIISENGMTTSQNLTIMRGDDRTFTFTCTDDGTLTGTPVNITGAKVWFTVKENLEDADADAIFQRRNLLAGGAATQIEMSDPSNGEFKVIIVPANTSGSEPGKMKFDAQVLLANGRTYTVTSGDFTISEDATRTAS